LAGCFKVNLAQSVSRSAVNTNRLDRMGCHSVD
jgi:hypothetical protein